MDTKNIKQEIFNFEILKEKFCKPKLFNTPLKTPLIAASGTFGYGEEYQFTQYKGLGAFVTKGLNLNGSSGNPLPRIKEIPTGLLNSIGLQNIGIKNFIKDIFPKIKNIGPKIIINFYGNTEEEYIETAQIINNIKNHILGAEVNVSCPNVKHGGLTFGEDPKTLGNLIYKIKKVAKYPIIVKLTPNTNNINILAKASIENGADAISLINTVKGLHIDISTGNIFLGGYSGKGIKPIAQRMVHEVKQNFPQIPIIAIGGIENSSDVLEYLMLGADFVEIGTSIFKDPNIFKEISQNLKKIFSC